MTDRRKTSDVLWMAFQCAKRDRETLIDAYRNDTSEEVVRNARKDIVSIERLQVRLFGTARSKADRMMDEMVPVDLLSVRNLKKILDESV